MHVNFTHTHTHTHTQTHAYIHTHTHTHTHTVHQSADDKTHGVHHFILVWVVPVAVGGLAITVTVFTVVVIIVFTRNKRVVVNVKVCLFQMEGKFFVYCVTTDL